LVFVFFQVLNFDLNGFIAKFANLDWRFLSLATFFSVLTIITNAYRWWIITKGFNYLISYSTALLWYFEGMFANNFFPSNVGGDALRAFYLASEPGVGKAYGQSEPVLKPDSALTSNHDWLSAGLTVILERLFGFTMMFFFFPLSLIFIYANNLSNSMPERLLQALFILSSIPFVAFFGYKLWIKIPIPLAIFQKVKLAISEFIVHKRFVFLVMLWTFITHVFLMAINVFSALALGISDIPFWYWFLLVPLATLASYVIPAVKGIGAREATYVFLLSILGVSSDNAFAIAVAVFLATVLSSVPGISLLRKGKEVFRIFKGSDKLG